MAKTLTVDEMKQKVASFGSNMGYSIASITESPTDASLQIVRINILDPDTLEAVEEVDVLTTANAVYFDNGRTLPEELDFLMQYTNSNAVPKAIGGIEEGSTFIDTPIKDIITALLYPYTKPNATLSSSVGTGYKPYGNNISPMVMTLTVDKKSEQITGADLLRNGSVYASYAGFPANGGTQYVSFNEDTSSIDGQLELVASVRDTKDSTTSNVLRYTFNRPIYYGSIAEDADISDALIKSMAVEYQYDTVKGTNNYSTKISKMFNPTEDCFFFAYRSSMKGYGDSKITVIDPNGFDITSSFSRQTIAITDPNGSTINYICWRSNKTSQSDFKLTINITWQDPK